MCVCERDTWQEGGMLRNQGGRAERMSCRDIRAGRPLADRALDDTRSSPRKEVPLFRRPSHSSLQSRRAGGSSRGRRFKPHRLQKCGNFRAISLALSCSRRTDGRDCFLADFLSRARLRPLFLAGGPKNLTSTSHPSLRAPLTLGTGLFR